MTLKKIVEELRLKGYNVEYYTRKDGSIRIYRIDEQKFDVSRSTGNARARELLGKSISPQKQAQIQRITPPSLPKEVSRALKRVQKLLREQNKADPLGKKKQRATAKQVRQRIEQVGEEKTIEELKVQEHILKGGIHPDRWLAFKTRAIDSLNLLSTYYPEVGSDIYNAINLLNAFDYKTLNESQFEIIVDVFYDVESAQNVNDLKTALSEFIPLIV